MKKLTRLLILLMFLSVFIVSALMMPDAKAAFTANNLMDDSVFNNSRSMSTADVQNFLNQFPSSCLKNLQAPYPNDYFNYGGNVSAATVIRRVSDLWDINPQVILATLEKESSVVTGNASYGCQYLNTSMGYNCPDSGACPGNPADAGFSQQVTKGAWLLKMAEERANGRVNYDPPLDPDDDRNYYYSGPMTEGNRQRRFDAPVQFFDGLLNIDGQTIHVDTGATASLYFYTPHFHGNQNFVSIFERWFGPTKGTVLIKGTGPTVYLLSSDTNVAYGIPTGQLIYDYGLQTTPITAVSDSYIASLNTTSALGNLFYQPNDGTVFLADLGYKIGISSGAYCTAWGLPCDQPSKIARLPYVVTSNMPARTPISNVMLYDNTLFLMSNGTKRPFMKYDDKAISPYSGELTTPILSPLNSGQPSGSPLLYSNMFFKVNQLGAIYYYSSGQYFGFSSFDSFRNWSDGSTVQLDRYSTFNSSPPAAVALPYFTSDGSTKSLVGGNVRFTFPASNGVSAISTATYPQLNSLVNSKQAVAIDDSKAFGLPGGTIATVRSNQLRPLPSLNDLFLSFSSNNIYNVPSALTDAFPIGKLYIIPGRVFKPADSSAMYAMGSDGYLWALGNLTELNATQRWSNGVVTAPFSSVEFSDVKIFTATLKLNGSYYSVQANGSIRTLPSATLTAQKDDYAMPVTGPMTARMPWDSATVSFIRFDNGTIFKVEGSTIRPISNMGTYSALGGTPTNTTQVSVKAGPMFNIGGPL